MALDISTLCAAAGTHDVKIKDKDGEVHDLTVHYKMPDHYQLLDVRRDAFGLFEKGRQLEKQMGETDDPESVRAEIGSGDYEAIFVFVEAQIVKMDGLEDGGEAVEWETLNRQVKRSLIRRISPADILQIFSAIANSVTLTEPEGND